MDYSVHYIETDLQLSECVSQLSKCYEIALDIEFDRERYTYGSTLCLIQIYGNGIVYLIDTLKDIDCKPLFALLQDQSILKIMHAPGEDLQMFHLQECFPRNIFDTERCARLLDYANYSLSSLVENFTGNFLDKSQQKTDWTKRPLKQTQLQYAAKDVCFLPLIQKQLREKASAKGILEWVDQENEAWDDYRAEKKPEGFLAGKDDVKRFPPFQLHLLNALLIFRDRYARDMNKPGYVIIRKENLTDLVNHPNQLREWMKTPGIHPKLKQASVFNELKNLLTDAISDAEKQNLSKVHLKTPYDKNTSYISKEKTDAKKEIFFRPIKTEIAKKYGENVAGYILSEKTISLIVSGKSSLNQLPFPYRINLIKETASNIGINLSDFL